MWPRASLRRCVPCSHRTDAGRRRRLPGRRVHFHPRAARVGTDLTATEPKHPGHRPPTTYISSAWPDLAGTWPPCRPCRAPSAPNGAERGIATLTDKPVLQGDNGSTLKATTVLAMLNWSGVKLPTRGLGSAAITRTPRQKPRSRAYLGCRLRALAQR